MVGRRIKEGLVGLAALAAVAGPVQAEDKVEVGKPGEGKAKASLVKAKGLVEMMSGHETSAFLNRNRVTGDYEGEMSTFHIAKLGYRIVAGLGVNVGFQGFSAKGISGWGGVEYGGRWGDFSAYQLVMVSMQETPQVMPLTSIRFTPKLKGDVRLLLELENVTYLSTGEGHLISSQRPRLGIVYDKFGAGVAVDLFEKGNEAKFGYNIGGYLRAGF
jgi:hypothetical protein